MKAMREGGTRQAKAGSTFIVGVFLGFAGAALDFYSGYQLLAQPGMAGVAQSWGVGILLLGVALAVTTLASLPDGFHRMKDVGGLMVVYGAAMLFVGASMYLGYTSMMQAAVPSAAGMLALGVLMVANGALMLRSPMA